MSVKRSWLLILVKTYFPTFASYPRTSLEEFLVIFVFEHALVRKWFRIDVYVRPLHSKHVESFLSRLLWMCRNVQCYNCNAFTPIMANSIKQATIQLNEHAFSPRHVHQTQAPVLFLSLRHASPAQSDHVDISSVRLATQISRRHSLRPSTSGVGDSRSPTRLVLVPADDEQGHFVNI